MVRCGVAGHPREWEWNAYHELVGIRKRYRVIDAKRLCWRLRTGSLEEVGSTGEKLARKSVLRPQIDMPFQVMCLRSSRMLRRQSTWVAKDKVLLGWQSQVLGPWQDQIVIVDGKKVRHAGVEIVNAVDSQGRFLGSTVTARKSNGIPPFKAGSNPLMADANDSMRSFTPNCRTCSTYETEKTRPRPSRRTREKALQSTVNDVFSRCVSCQMATRPIVNKRYYAQKSTPLPLRTCTLAESANYCS